MSYNFIILLNRFINIYESPKPPWLATEIEAGAEYVRFEAAMGCEESDAVDRRFVTEQSMKPITWWVEIPTF